MREFVLQFLNMPLRERRALFLLIIICFVFSLSLLIMDRIARPVPCMLQFTELPYEDESVPTPANQNSAGNKSFNQLRIFDPNLFSEEELIRAGLPEKFASQIIHFREHNGHFYKKEDLKKLYGCSDEKYRYYEPYIYVGKKAQKSAADYQSNESKPPKQQIDLNRADTLELMKLPMIGSGRARMILKYREAIGGYVSKDQLHEVFGINDTVYRAIADRISIAEGFQPKRIRINSASGEQIWRHPYLRQMQKALMDRRKQKTPIHNTEEWLKLPSVPEEQLRKALPYIDLSME